MIENSTLLKTAYGVNMSKKTLKNNHAKASPLMTAAKVITLGLTLYFSCAVTVLSGAGLIYNRESYGSSLAAAGVFFIISALLMTIGAILCIPHKNLPNILSAVMSAAGLVLCMIMLKKLTSHADLSGWTDKYSLTPISSMYRSRILPCIVPAVLTVIISLIQFFSYEQSQQRRKRKNEKENAPAPSIIDD